MLDDTEQELLFSRDSAFPTREVRENIAAARERIFGEIDRFKLWHAVAELDAKGFAVIPPEDAAPAGFAEAVRGALLAASAENNGVAPDVEKGTTHANIVSRHGNVEIIEPLLHRNSIFCDALLNERLLAVVTYLLDESCILLSNSGQVKGPGRHYLPLHTDQGLTGGPTSFSSLANVCNAVWVLSDYTGDNGATAFVPGSHRFCRHPTEAEIRDASNYMPLEVKAGSILIWHGNTWHGAVPRKNPGLRLGIIHYFGRWYSRRNDDVRRLMPAEEIARRPQRFAYLIGANVKKSSDESGIAPAAIFSKFG